MKPQISIILPSYSGEKTINKTITSIFLQTYTNFELLISVYKKKVNIIKICEKFKSKHNKKIKIFIHEKKLLPSENHNFLYNKCNTKYFLLVHDDDYLDKDYIKNGIKIISKKKDISGVAGNIISFGKKYKINPLLSYLNGSLEERIKNYITYRYGDFMLHSIFRTKKPNYSMSEKMFNSEVFMHFEILLNGKLETTSKMKYYKKYKDIRDLKSRAKHYELSVYNVFARYGVYISIFFSILTSQLILKKKLYLSFLLFKKVVIDRNFLSKKLI